MVQYLVLDARWKKGTKKAKKYFFGSESITCTDRGKWSVKTHNTDVGRAGDANAETALGVEKPSKPINDKY